MYSLAGLVALQKRPAQALSLLEEAVAHGLTAVIARFDSERHALAMMDHPNIARVFEAGETTAGKPYFVVEYVPGVPITEYCDQRVLGCC